MRILYKAENLICAAQKQSNKADECSAVRKLETDCLVRTKRETQIDDGELSACMS